MPRNIQANHCGDRADDEVTEFVMRAGGEPFPGNSKLIRELLAEEIKNWADYVKIAKIPLIE